MVLPFTLLLKRKPAWHVIQLSSVGQVYQHLEHVNTTWLHGAGVGIVSIRVRVYVCVCIYTIKWLISHLSQEVIG